MNSGELIKALTVPFVAGLIVQRFLEIVDPYTTAKLTNPNVKKFVMGILSLVLGWLLAVYGHIKIFHALQWPDIKCGWDIFFSGIFISAGTEGFNSLLKFAGYKKDAAKGDAAGKLATVGKDAVEAVNP